jgi:hypothetical protein
MTNKLQPWEMRINQAESNRQMGVQNMFGGAEGALGNIMDFAGTDYYKNILNKLKGQG